MNDEEWKSQLSNLSNKELTKECEKLSDWADSYYGDLVDVLVDEIKKRLAKEEEAVK